VQFIFFAIFGISLLLYQQGGDKFFLEKQATAIKKQTKKGIWSLKKAN
jgi:hypothetical protein